MRKRATGKLITTEEAVKAKGQHTNPCSDCPWARASMPGWVGAITREEWIADAHGEAKIECHVLIGAQCAGAAIYRANVCKTPRDPELLRLPTNRDKVFATPREFLDHHDMEKVSENLRKRKP